MVNTCPQADAAASRHASITATSGSNRLAREQKLELQMDALTKVRCLDSRPSAHSPMDRPDSDTVTYVPGHRVPPETPPVSSCREMAFTLSQSLPTEISLSDPSALFSRDFTFEHPVVVFCTSLLPKSSTKHPEIGNPLRG
jgi:hypothetical protein